MQAMYCTEISVQYRYRYRYRYSDQFSLIQPKYANPLILKWFHLFQPTLEFAPFPCRNTVNHRLKIPRRKTVPAPAPAPNSSTLSPVLCTTMHHCSPNNDASMGKRIAA